MKAWQKLALGIAVTVIFVFVFRMLVGDSIVALLDPRGFVAMRQRDVILKMTLIMLAGALPTLVVLYAVVWKYRSDNPKAKYDPDRPTKPWNELLLWAAPAALVMVLWGVVWSSTHALDPYAAITSDKPPMRIQVVALRWKWLFVYPKEGVATVNHVVFPADTPVHFELTADGPVSSFWIPQLGSQIYAMASMMTRLNLIAEPGEYAGKNTEINGVGYSEMTFVARAVPQDEFDSWVLATKQSPAALDAATYEVLTEPTTNHEQTSYASVEPGLFNAILMKYMNPPAAEPGKERPELNMHGM